MKKRNDDKGQELDDVVTGDAITGGTQRNDDEQPEHEAEVSHPDHASSITDRARDVGTSLEQSNDDDGSEASNRAEEVGEGDPAVIDEDDSHDENDPVDQDLMDAEGRATLPPEEQDDEEEITSNSILAQDIDQDLDDADEEEDDLDDNEDAAEDEEEDAAGLDEDEDDTPLTRHNTHREDAVLRARAATAVDPYDPPSRMSTEPQPNEAEVPLSAVLSDLRGTGKSKKDSAEDGSEKDQ